jgi:predicted ribosomally synthesized peptide with nif11-like leader
MSKEDAERFVADLRTNPSLFEEVRSTGSGLSGVISIANSKGYDVSMDDARTYLESRAQGHLSDAQLGRIAAGKGKGPTTTTATVQSTVAVTTVIGVAEAVVSIVVVLT